MRDRKMLKRPWGGLAAGIVVAVLLRGMIGCSGETAEEVAEVPVLPATATAAASEIPDSVVDLGNTTCPVMGLEVAEGQYADWNGFRVHFCCAGCDDRFLADPEAYLPILAEDPAVAEKLGALKEGNGSETAVKDTDCLAPGQDCGDDGCSCDLPAAPACGGCR